ncbi:hypothetical protein [Streptomyces fuscichromogenes]|uniref:Uncharacterized protein n=1 Tax=Streptomyces fuscichromogenes TaxID=1324013 RepID=A0A917XQD5_9ACTN|nr:hypothetical protein [Streptomyces fuscichromogenes]GGN46155.1 hypothetical protein GCM10011578_098780 [Streptomyces fuscichromogenes]
MAAGRAGQEWWEQAVAFVPGLVAAEPAPEAARLAALVFDACPPGRAAQLEAVVRTALGTPLPAALLAEVLPAGTERVDGTVEPLASWLPVWGWLARSRAASTSRSNDPHRSQGSSSPRCAAPIPQQSAAPPSVRRPRSWPTPPF